MLWQSIPLEMRGKTLSKIYYIMSFIHSIFSTILIQFQSSKLGRFSSKQIHVIKKISLSIYDMISIKIQLRIFSSTH